MSCAGIPAFDVQRAKDRNEMRVLKGVVYMLKRMEPRSEPEVSHRKGDRRVM